MCGIVGIFEIKTEQKALRLQALEQAKKIRHRGPDWSGIYSDDSAILAHERLAIVDVTSGNQPLASSNSEIVLAVNGEIYNHLELRSSLERPYDFKTKSDCEILLPLYQQKGVSFFNQLNGIFSFALYNSNKKQYLIGRDHIGIIPLYYGRDEKNRLYVASELKALEGYCIWFEEFPPGHYLTEKDDKPVRWYEKSWRQYGNVKSSKTTVEDIKKSLEDAVHRQLMSDVPYGVLLSGGLDSSVISAITKKYAAKRIEENDGQDAWWPSLHSFAIGLKGSPDLLAAKKVADHIGTIHHEVIFTVQEGIDALRDVIYHLETYDVTTIRASTPMYLLARVIKSMGIKMVLSGEGSDEIFGGYLYFHKAPNAEEFHEETVRKLSRLHQYDCLRANKSLAAWGVEGRVPFLDPEFLDTAMGIDPEQKLIKNGRIEKWVLREAFASYLPD
ncbi:MAG: asparagine synthase B, partial [Bacteroidota bacterium]